MKRKITSVWVQSALPEQVIAFGWFDSPFGPAVLFGGAPPLLAVGFAAEHPPENVALSLRRQLARHFPKARFVRDEGTLRVFAEALLANGPDARLPLFPLGTAFQRRVWQALSQLRGGETISYRALAQRLGREEATRAVASAVGANPLAYAIPCHRVIGADGALCGYRWGLQVKRAMLLTEGADLSAAKHC